MLDSAKLKQMGIQFLIDSPFYGVCFWAGAVIVSIFVDYFILKLDGLVNCRFDKALLWSRIHLT